MACRDKQQTIHNFCGKSKLKKKIFNKILLLLLLYVFKRLRVKVTRKLAIGKSEQEY